MAAIVEAIGSSEFLAGLRWGGITGFVALLGSVVWERRERRAPVAGLAVLGAVIFAMPIARDFNANLFAGLGLLVIAGLAFRWTRRFPLGPVIAAIPGAWLIGGSDLPRSRGVVFLVVAVIAIGGPVISWFDEEANGSPFPTLLFALAVAGVWITVPDTDEALVLLGAMTAPTLLAWPLRVARFGPVGVHGLVGLFMWVIAWGGRGRPGSIVGAAAALGMLMAAPFAAWMAKKRSVTTSGWSGPTLLALHAIVVALVTRVAGLKTDALEAAAIAASIIVTAVLLWLLVEQRTAQGTPRITGSD